MVCLCQLDLQLRCNRTENKRASAIAIMFTGLTVATITGVPIGTFIGQQFGWRASFMAIVVMELLLSSQTVYSSHLI